MNGRRLRRQVFRPARPASPGRHLVMSALQCAGLSAAFLVTAPLVVRRLEDRLGLPRPSGRAGAAARAAGSGLLLASTTLNMASAATMAVQGGGTPLPLDTARRLVIRGPYRWVRNPMAIGGIGQGIAVGLLLRSPLVVAYALAGAVLWQGAFRSSEEQDLLERFGAPYAAYREQVRCWIPRRTPVEPLGPTGATGIGGAVSARRRGGRAPRR